MPNENYLCKSNICMLDKIKQCVFYRLGLVIINVYVLYMYA